MKIEDLFVAKVTRDIPPVVYFHEQSPAKLEAEVSEYIITGGLLESDPGARRLKSGIHEQFVHLLGGIAREMRKPAGPELPASWISGFFGSGKSSFAKLLGLALDGAQLPDGQLLSTALLQRDDSPRRQELVDAWSALTQLLDPIAVVFDIGGVAQNHEHIHSAAMRQLQARLGYCKSHLVADFELRLERDGEYGAFEALAKKTLGKEWQLAKQDAQAEDHFSHVLHVMKPERYPDPTSWIDSRAGSSTNAGSSVREVVAAIENMVHLRAPDKVLFIVVDEVSQYLEQDDNRVLKLQSFVSDLGQRLKGRVWLVATGQQKLEDQAETNPIGKLKDRFPAQLRVHLAATNIRDVVHKRLLKKKPEHEATLRELFQKHRGDLKLYGYACENITEEDFVELYPMLPGYIDLLMQVTSNLRARWSRGQGDEHAIRGLLQLLGELFRKQKLADGELGQLVTLDAIYEVQHSALEADVQTSLGRIMSDPRVQGDVTAQRVVKAVALLELIQEQTATTPELVAACLYTKLGCGNRVQAASEALDKLRGLCMLSYSEKCGFKIQSSAGQEWQRERDDIGVTQEHLSLIVQNALKALVGSTQERARWKGRTFPWALWFSDDRQASDVKLQEVREDSPVAVDFRHLARSEDREPDAWVPKSDQEPLRNRLLWVVGEPAGIEDHARQLARSARMLERYRARRESLSRDKQRLLIEEEARFDELERRVRGAVSEAFVEGTVYFRGQQLRPREVATALGPVLSALAVRALPELYPHFSEIAISPKELEQLLDKELAGPSTKFMEGGLGILALDAGKYVAACTGVYPARISAHIDSNDGLCGQALVAAFVSSPYGYAPELVKACCAGLLRGKKIRIRTEQGTDIKSHLDPGVRDLFSRDRDFRRAEFFSARDSEVSGKDRIAIAKLFERYLHVEQEREDEPIADTVFQEFQPARDNLRKLEQKCADLPGRPTLPLALRKLGRALEDCCRSRFVHQTVSEVKRNLDVLRDGFEQLAVISRELNQDAIDTLSRAARVRDVELAQLRHLQQLEGLEADAELLEKHLSAERPWREASQLAPALERICARYLAARAALIHSQSERADAAIHAVKVRATFAQLDADQAHRVLRPIRDLLLETTAAAVSPSLAEMRDRFASRIHLAEEEAFDKLDEAVSHLPDLQVIKVELRLRAREIENRAQLEALLRELEDRLAPLLVEGTRIRLA